MKNYLEHIDEYLSGSLGDEEQQDFLQQLETDQKLKNEVKFHQEVLKGIEQFGKAEFETTLFSVEDELDREGFFSTSEEKDIIDGIETVGRSDFESIVKEVDEELEKESFYAKPKTSESSAKIVRLHSRRRLLAIAASVAIIAVVAVLFWPQPDFEQIYASNFELILDPVSAELNIEKGEIGFAGNNEPLLALESAMNLYNQANCVEFINGSTPLLEESALNHYQGRLHLLRGVCYMSSEQFQQAETSLFLANDSAANKYLLLTFIKTENFEKARQLFDSLEAPSEELIKLYNQID